MKFIQIIPALVCLSALAAQDPVPFDLQSSYRSQDPGKPNLIYWQAPPTMQNCQLKSALYSSRVENIGHIQLFPRETTKFSLSCSNVGSESEATKTLTVEVGEGPTLWDEAWDWGHHANHALFENVLNPFLVGVILTHIPFFGQFFGGGHGHAHQE